MIDYYYSKGEYFKDLQSIQIIDPSIYKGVVCPLRGGFYLEERKGE